MNLWYNTYQARGPAYRAGREQAPIHPSSSTSWTAPTPTTTAPKHPPTTTLKPPSSTNNGPHPSPQQHPQTKPAVAPANSSLGASSTFTSSRPGQERGPCLRLGR
ncbi:hypothetical protein CONLIGDRAFT_636930 [Coniochaeta ligniaria NRRL 30616]|uniref:Uncharacterized protein n=1 Tax=Coniochaeta ligniaria NRRL 30616 TaxID=1408157 RepID=A0A1J7I9R2_9PEZI|nr:hypothetical protein CONLIGDRAFT_636930 [Coniochaeta ligniaria NRRL 30616]